jgi:glycine cleavage system aminomethyltransferase T
VQDDERVTISDESEAFAITVVMGPDSSATLEKLGANAITKPQVFRAHRNEIAVLRCVLSPLSYVAVSDGYEVSARPMTRPNSSTHAEPGPMPAGFMHTAMRIEKRFLAMGTSGR